MKHVARHIRLGIWGTVSRSAREIKAWEPECPAKVATRLLLGAAACRLMPRWQAQWPFLLLYSLFMAWDVLRSEDLDIGLRTRAWIRSIWSFIITEEAPTRRAFSWLKVPTSAFTVKTLLRHYAKRALTLWSLNVKLGPWQNYHMGRAAIRHYANQTARPLWPLCRGPNFTLRDCGVNAQLA